MFNLFEVSVKLFCRIWEGKTLPKWFFIFKQLKEMQNKYYPDNKNLVCFCRRTSLHALMFPISLLKTNLWWYWKWQTFDGKI